MDTRKLMIALTLAGAAGGAGAQQISKYSTADGSIGYTDRPPAGAQATRRLDMTLAMSSPASSTSYATERGSPTSADGNIAPDSLNENLAAARTEMRAAKLRRISGVAALPEERNGQHFKPEYWQRQRALAQGLVLARARVVQAFAVTPQQ